MIHPCTDVVFHNILAGHLELTLQKNKFNSHLYWCSLRHGLVQFLSTSFTQQTLSFLAGPPNAFIHMVSSTTQSSSCLWDSSLHVIALWLPLTHKQWLSTEVRGSFNHTCAICRRDLSMQVIIWTDDSPGISASTTSCWALNSDKGSHSAYPDTEGRWCSWWVGFWLNGCLLYTRHLPDLIFRFFFPEVFQPKKQLEAQCSPS